LVLAFSFIPSPRPPLDRTPTTTHKTKNQKTKQKHINRYVRDLPYAYDFLIENVADPAHLPVSHHGLAGILNRARAKPVPMVPISDDDDENENEKSSSLPPPPPAAPGTPTPTLDFRMASVLAPPADTRPLSRLSWWAPGLVRYRYPAGSMTFSTNLYVRGLLFFFFSFRWKWRAPVCACSFFVFGRGAAQAPPIPRPSHAHTHPVTTHTPPTH
jgi:phenylpropionate dioxygenase-like ring-hydroxylating dioxygenase large terminal subunit